MKRIFALCMAVLLGMLALGAVAIAEPATSGYCGSSSNAGGEQSLKWSFNEDTGVLTISGTGEMAYYAYALGTKVPWEAFREKIVSVVIGNGVTSIGAEAFAECENLVSVTLPSSLEAIDREAFDKCTSLASITLPSSLKWIGGEAFRRTHSLTSITLPSSLEGIGPYAFYGSGIRSITIPASVSEILSGALSPLQTVRYLGYSEPAHEAVTFKDPNKVRVIVPETYSGESFCGAAVVRSCAVNFNANGGEGIMPAQEFISDEEQKIRACGFSRSGYTFAGWNTKVDGSGTAYADKASVKIASGVTLYAQWERISVKLAIFYPNGGQGSMKPQNLSGSSAVLNKNTYVREGYEFAGWNTAGNGSGDFYEDGARVPTANSIILYAQWKEVEAPAVTEAPTATPTAVPTAVPTAEPTVVPTAAPTAVPTAVPTAIPTAIPTAAPTCEPGATPVPTAVPTAAPTARPPVSHGPKIVAQPKDQFVVVGQRTTFSVEAVGEGLNYQWYINRGDGWAKIADAIGASCTTSVVDADCDGFEYKCIVTDRDGCRAETETAALYVAEAPVIPETGDKAMPHVWLAMALIGVVGLALLCRKEHA